jgi:uncharacterized protein (TIGR03067 family)
MFKRYEIMKPSFILLVLICVLSCGAPKSNDQANLHGSWLAQTESQNGKKWSVSYLYVFREDKLFFTDETGEVVTYSYKLDTTGSLKFIIIQPDETLNISEPVSIAYELDGDSLKIAVAPSGLRPTEISDKNNQELIICKRKDS